MTTLIVILWMAYILAWCVEHRIGYPFWHLLRAGSRRSVIGKTLLLAVVCAIGSDKSPVPRLLTMLMFDPLVSQVLPSGFAASKSTSVSLAGQLDDIASVGTATSNAVADAVTLVGLVESAFTNAQMVTLDLDWNHASRVPDAPNIMASRILVTQTNIDGTLFDNHYVSFSQQPTESPSMLFDYYDLSGERHLVQASTNSFPDQFAVYQPSGVHSCYWFRCAVPVSFISRIRTWDAEVRFGAPIGSDYGFSAAGIFLIDNGSMVWRGDTRSTVIGGRSVDFINGIAVPSATDQAEQDQPLLLSRSHKRSSLLTPSNIVVTSLGSSNIYSLGFGYKSNPKSLSVQR